MIITSCPLRISLVGGSTDHPHFLKKYKTGSVISFPSTLRVYTTLHQDVFGSTSLDRNYILSYSQRESVPNIENIQNELIKNCFKHLNVSPINCFLTSDVFSSGSGLASSSAYLLSLIKSIYSLRKQKITEFEVCKIAETIEKTFNPLVGQQDFFGSIGGLKKIQFYEDKDPTIRYLNTQIFQQLDCYLIFTGVLRSSTDVLKSIDVTKSTILLDDVKDLEIAIQQNNVNDFNSIISRTWENKKQTSPYICENPSLIELDKKIKSDKNILSHKLLGAGNGGYFLIFTQKGLGNYISSSYNHTQQIHISEQGLKTINLYEY